jgi:hypothetical protein
MARIERAVGGEAIAFFGHRAGDDHGGRAGQRRADLLARARPQILAVDAENPKARLGVENRQRVAAPLAGEGFDRPGRAQRHRGDAPTRIVGQQPVDIIGLMGAVESAGAEMNDAGRGGPLFRDSVGNRESAHIFFIAKRYAAATPQWPILDHAAMGLKDFAPATMTRR